MAGTRSRDFFLGVIATCLLLITVRVYDTSFTKRAHADEPTKPMEVVIVGSNPLVLADPKKPIRVELFRNGGVNYGDHYVPLFDPAQGLNQRGGALPVEIMARSGGALAPLRVNSSGALETSR